MNIKLSDIKYDLEAGNITADEALILSWDAGLDMAEDRLSSYLDAPENSDDELFQQGIQRGLKEIKKTKII